MDTPTVLITDLDNTLWDWFHAWHASFSAMLECLEHISGVSADVLKPEIRAVHQSRATSEYSYLLNELPSLAEAAGDGEVPLIKYDKAVHAMNSARIANTRLYPGVIETLRDLKACDIKIVAYTESVAFWTEWRIKHTGLDGLIDVLYSAPDHDLPRGVSFDDLRSLPPEDYGLRLTDHRHVPKGSTKPDEAVLLSILEDCRLTPDEALYVGDSLMKDVVMAQRAGVPDVHAKYGEVQRLAGYALLQQVSHWPDTDVAREQVLLKTNEVRPSHILENGFEEILDLFPTLAVRK